MNIDVNVVQKILTQQIKQQRNRIIHCNQGKFILGIQVWFNIEKSFNAIHQNNKLNQKNRIIV